MTAKAVPLTQGNASVSVKVALPSNSAVNATCSLSVALNVMPPPPILFTIDSNAGDFVASSGYAVKLAFTAPPGMSSCSILRDGIPLPATSPTTCNASNTCSGGPTEMMLLNATLVSTVSTMVVSCTTANGKTVTSPAWKIKTNPAPSVQFSIQNGSNQSVSSGAIVANGTEVKMSFVASAGMSKCSFQKDSVVFKDLACPTAESCSGTRDLAPLLNPSASAVTYHYSVKCTVDQTNIQITSNSVNITINPAVAPTAQLSASVSSAPINSQVTLNYSTQNATSCAIDISGAENVHIVLDLTKTSFTRALAGTSNYQVNCWNGAVTGSSGFVTITAVGLSVSLSVLDAAGNAIAPGTSIVNGTNVKLSFNASLGMASCSVNSTPPRTFTCSSGSACSGMTDLFALNNAGTSPAAFTFSASCAPQAGGNNINSSAITVNVTPNAVAPVASLSSPTSATSIGSTIVLNYSIQNATSCYLDIKGAESAHFQIALNQTSLSRQILGTSTYQVQCMNGTLSGNSNSLTITALAPGVSLDISGFSNFVQTKSNLGIVHYSATGIDPNSCSLQVGAGTVSNASSGSYNITTVWGTNQLAQFSCRDFNGASQSKTVNIGAGWGTAPAHADLYWVGCPSGSCDAVTASGCTAKSDKTVGVYDYNYRIILKTGNCSNNLPSSFSFNLNQDGTLKDFVFAGNMTSFSAGPVPATTVTHIKGYFQTAGRNAFTIVPRYR